MYFLEDGDATAFSQRLRRSYGAVPAFYCVPTAFLLAVVALRRRSYSVSTACIALSLRVYCAFTARPLRALRFHCASTACIALLRRSHCVDGAFVCITYENEV